MDVYLLCLKWIIILTFAMACINATLELLAELTRTAYKKIRIKCFYKRWKDDTPSPTVTCYCAHCKYWKPVLTDLGRCAITNDMERWNWFCPNGEIGPQTIKKEE